MKQGKLLIFSAPSGGGKTTVVKHLLKQNFNLHFSISATTRPIRKTEEDGKDYHFMTKEDFFKKIEEDAFLEWEEVYKEKYYGTLKSSVDTMLVKGKNVIFDIDVVGGLNIKQTYGDKALAIFVQPISVQVLKKRLIKRAEDSVVSLKERLKKAKWELMQVKKFDQVLVSNVLKDTLKKAEEIVARFLNE